MPRKANHNRTAALLGDEGLEVRGDGVERALVGGRLRRRGSAQESGQRALDVIPLGEVLSVPSISSRRYYEENGNTS